MPAKEHSFAHAFPEMGEQFHQLKSKNSHFAALSDKFESVDHTIHRFESGAESYTDEQLEILKKQRLALKDELFGLLKKAA